MTMQTRELERDAVLRASDKENSGANSASASRAKLRSFGSSTSSSSGQSERRAASGLAFDRDRFKLVQSHRGEPDADARADAPRSSDAPDDAAPPASKSAKPPAKKEPPPQPVVPEQVVECVLDAHGFVQTRTYRKGKFLGKGGFARCYELTCEQTGAVYAGKIVAKSSLAKPKARHKFTTEIKIHKSLQHAHVVQFEHFFEDAENAYLLLELCRNQSLADLLRRRQRLSEGEVRFYLRQLVEGLRYLHAQLVIHRDLKLGNLFLTADMRLQIGDFGLATRLERPDDRKRTMCGTPNYIAPEILSGQRGAGHSFEVDVWSTGVVLYTLLVGRPPFETDDVKATYKRIRANQFDFPDAPLVSRPAKSLIRAILRSDPAARPSLEQILAHPFLADEPIPSSLPRTALLITPPACKNQVAGGRHGDSDRFAASGSVRIPPPAAAARRHPLRSRDVNTQAGSRGICHDRVSDAGASPAMARSLPPHKRDAVARGSASVGTSTTRRHLAATSSVSPASAATRAASLSPPTTGVPAAATSAGPSNPLEKAYKTLSRFFYLQEHGGGSESGQHAAAQRLSEFSSASAIVAAAQRLKEIRAEAEEPKPLLPAPLWISQWVDYTSKYGIGYMLSNGSSGVYFNDSTKIISSADGRVFEYMPRQTEEDAGQPESRTRYAMDTYDVALRKKVTLLGHFKGYLVDARAENDEVEALENQLSRSFVQASGEMSDAEAPAASRDMVYVKKWVKTRHAVLFQLSNGTCQFNFFDKSKLVLSPSARVATYLNREGDLAAFSTAAAVLTSDKPDLSKRLRYAKDMLQQMVRPASKS